MGTQPGLNVAVLVPRRAGIEDRDRLWAFARAWWENDHPDWRIIEGHHDVGAFNRGAALNTAARLAAGWDVAVIIDSDVLIEAAAVTAAADLAHRSGGMVLGYNERIHLTPQGTDRILGGYRGNWMSRGMVAKRLLDACSSCVVVSRRLWDQVGGFDERFVGWGWEDIAFRVACETLSGIEMRRMTAQLFHLAHRTSHENNRHELTFQRNKIRGERYIAAHWNPAAVRALLDEPAVDLGDDADPTRIPRILHRTVPAAPDPRADALWEHWRQLLPGWQLLTHRDPLDPAGWPELGDLHQRCQNGAQLAGLIRLEALWRWGGVYVDSDVEPYRDLGPLLHLRGFAGWEDANVVPDAVLGFEPAHPAVRVMIGHARTAIETGADAWQSGPGVTTAVLPGRADVLLLPPGSFYPYHYTERHRAKEDHRTAQPWAFAAHHWAGSWLTPAQRARQDR